MSLPPEGVRIDRRSNLCSNTAMEVGTPILLADGSTKPLAEVRVGDSVYATVREGRYHRFVRTEVLARWSTVEPVYRVTLQDKTELVAGKDDMFLTRARGWKHVIGCMNGADRRPYLTTGNELMGTGAFASPPRESTAYRRGYVCGMVRGDAHLGVYSYPRGGRAGVVHRFRLALVDLEALDRTYRYLESFGIRTDRFAFSPATETRREVVGIRTSTGPRVQAIQNLIKWSRDVTDEWAKGFLAGIFDAEGSCSRGILRIANTDPEILHYIQECFARFELGMKLEFSGRCDGLCVVRLTGGMHERLRFFHMVGPAITRKQSIEGGAIKNKAILRVVSVEASDARARMPNIATRVGNFIGNGVVSSSAASYGVWS